MTLAQYLQTSNLSYGEFARRIGAKNARTVQRYCKGLRLPSPAMMALIERETGGEVLPGSFYPRAA